MNNYVTVNGMSPDLKHKKEITREGCCDKFSGRRCLFPIRKNCWFCQFAWFDADGIELPVKGSCCFPQKQTN